MRITAGRSCTTDSIRPASADHWLCVNPSQSFSLMPLPAVYNDICGYCDLSEVCINAAYGRFSDTFEVDWTNFQQKKADCTPVCLNWLLTV